MNKYRGNPIYDIDGIWYYSDTGDPVIYSKGKPCGKCDKPYTSEGHDPCIASLPYIRNACCGHGEPQEAYLQFMNGKCVRGRLAVFVTKILKLMRRNVKNN